ncbi:hypothetical protein G7Y89_g9878 [Cudoniella acicularis]|uniref:Uncharacterized protein n=1 Tax=Cudoniella acicularis TaxID=354080 RepID=A0A8H4VZ87_9HELO|nr:hypothetical protein G7Y89_g9878 [Cudoniella acicularis]
MNETTDRLSLIQSGGAGRSEYVPRVANGLRTEMLPGCGSNSKRPAALWPPEAENIVTEAFGVDLDWVAERGRAGQALWRWEWRGHHW